MIRTFVFPSLVIQISNGNRSSNVHHLSLWNKSRSTTIRRDLECSDANFKSLRRNVREFSSRLNFTFHFSLLFHFTSSFRKSFRTICSMSILSSIFLYGISFCFFSLFVLHCVFIVGRMDDSQRITMYKNACMFDVYPSG